MRRIALALLLALAPVAAPLAADPDPYTLDRDASTVSFSYTLLGVAATGSMPIASADIALDFDRAAASHADVTLNVAAATTSNPMATEALKSAEVLAADRYPRIRFVSREVAARPGGARILGDVTIRDVTRPMRLDARIFRPEDAAPGDRSRLTVVLTGAVERSAFGATGYAGAVGDEVGLRITARLRRAD